METELKQQAHKIVKLEAEKKKLQQDINHLKDVQQGVRRTIEEKTSRIELLQKENIEKNKLVKDVQQGVRRMIEEKTSLIELVEKENIEKK